MAGDPVKLILRIDGYHHEIDSTDPEIIGKWLVEIFARIGPTWSPATFIQMQVQPSYLPAVPGGEPQFDWIADTRFTGRLYPVKSPREVVEVLGKMIDEYEGTTHDPASD